MLYSDLIVNCIMGYLTTYAQPVLRQDKEEQALLHVLLGRSRPSHQPNLQQPHVASATLHPAGTIS